jgi:protein phosphatase
VPQGAIDYTSPEYIQYGSALQISDLYSIGVIVYEMLCGELPYKARGVGDKHYAWLYRSIRIRRPDIPLWVDLALEKSVDPKPVKRQQALSEFLHDMCFPNESLVRQHKLEPLLERNPVLVWQSISALLLLALVLTYVY